MTLRNDPLLQERGRAEAIMCVAIAVVLVGPVACCDSDRVAVAYRTVSLVLLFCCSCCFSIIFHLVPFQLSFVFALIEALHTAHWLAMFFLQFFFTAFHG